jgi:hypothetical protein
MTSKLRAANDKVIPNSILLMLISKAHFDQNFTFLISSNCRELVVKALAPRWRFAVYAS